jgi:hypothetical protein
VALKARSNILPLEITVALKARSNILPLEITVALKAHSKYHHKNIVAQKPTIILGFANGKNNLNIYIL